MTGRVVDAANPTTGIAGVTVTITPITTLAACPTPITALTDTNGYFAATVHKVLND